MARTLKDSKLDTRAARQRLKARREPYWRTLSEGLGIGYRKGTKGGTWIARHYSPERGRRFQSIGTADDVVDADSVHVLSYDQAQEKARGWFAGLAKQDEGTRQVAPLTVDGVFDLYFASLEREGRPTKDARCRYNGSIKPVFGSKEAGKITTEQFEKWLDELVNSPPRLRTKPGKKQQYRKPDTSDEGKRRRRATAKRLWNWLQAALNTAFLAGKIASDAEWKRVKAFSDVDGVRLDYLSIAESTRLVNAADSEFRPIIQAGLLTGARYGAIAALTVGDFDPDAGTVRLTSRKGRGKVKIYHCHLTAEGITFFKAACAGRNDPAGLLFRKRDGSAWGPAHQKRPMEDAVKNARIGRRISFHHLRHTWASHAVMNGTPLLVVAGNLGHSDTRMVEKHYGHLAPSYRKQEIEKGAPVFGIELDSVVTSLDDRRAVA